MSIVFFEGFNYDNSDNIKLNPNFWTVNDVSRLSFGSGRTGNQIQLNNRSTTDANLSNNTVLTLQNFTDPLVSSSGFALGFAINNRISHMRTDLSSSPHLENFVKFYNDSNNEVLSIDIIGTSGNYGNSLGFAIYQNNSLVDVYDLKSHIGYSWSFNQTVGPGGVGYFFSLTSFPYIDIYIDPVNNQHISINLSANLTNNAQLRNTSDEYYTAISGFNSLSKIEFYSQNTSNSFSPTTNLDDLYIKSGNTREDAVIGDSVKIYKLSFDNNTSQNDWQTIPSSPGSEFAYVSSNDGDLSYVLSSNSGDISIYNLNNLPHNSPSGVGGIKISNIVRSSDIDANWNFANVISDGSAVVQDTVIYTVDSTIYSHKENFIFQNPITETDWTKDDINNLQIGLKNLGLID
jgi:hypothetical protein